MHSIGRVDFLILCDAHFDKMTVIVILVWPLDGYFFIIIIIVVIFQCYFSGEHIALSIKKNNNNNGVNIELGKTNRLKAQCMMQINT